MLILHKIFVMFFFKDRVFSNVMFNVISDTDTNGNVVNLFSRRSRWYSCFADEFSLIAVFPIRNILSRLVILLNATYIWPWLKDLWRCRSKLITPSSKLRPCTFRTVHAHDNTNGKGVLLMHGCDLFFLWPNDTSCFMIDTHYSWRAK